ncbi:MAG: patatin-like phospholipase family protein [Thermoanaerobaculales bacterium]
MKSIKKRTLRMTWRIKPPVLALGGGGARGFAHLGFLDVLDEARLPIRAIVGTSMGAVNGGMYLAYGSAARAIEVWREALERGLIPAVAPIRRMVAADSSEHPLLQIARRIRNRVVISFAVNRSTVLDQKDMVKALEFLIPDVRFDDLSCPMMAVATDLQTGEEVRLRDGPLRPALAASGAIPGIIPAVEIGGRWLLDGAVVAEVPVAAARELGWPVVAVDASMDVPPISEADLVLDTMMRTQMMTARLLRRRQIRRATHVIRPRVGHVSWAEWHHFEDLLEEGRKAAREFLGL